MASISYTGAAATAHTTGTITTAASGSTMVVVVVNNGSAVSPSSVTDSKSNAYTLVNSRVDSGSGWTHHTYIKSSAAGGTLHSFTANYAAAQTCSILFYEETTGGSIADTTKATGIAAASPRTLATAAAVDSGGLVFYSGASSFGATETFTGNDGYVKLVEQAVGTSSYSCALFSKAAASTAVQTGSYSQTGSDSTMSIFGMVGAAAAASVNVVAIL